MILDFPRSGKPTDNAFIEAFNGRLQEGYVNTDCLMSMLDAQEKLESWRRHFNEHRPLDVNGNGTPIALAFSDFVPSPKSGN